MRVCPPTSTTSLILLVSTPASVMHWRHGPTERWMISSTIASSFPLVSFLTRCFGPPASAVIKGRLISVSSVVESSILARSAASLRRCNAISLPLLPRSSPSSFLNSSTSQSTMRWSISSPPRCVSPLVAFTSMTPSPTSRMEISNVPPPKSYTAIVSSFFLSSPYASAAAVGSLMIRFTSIPAISPASLVAWRWASLK